MQHTPVLRLWALISCFAFSIFLLHEWQRLYTRTHEDEGLDLDLQYQPEGTHDSSDSVTLVVASQRKDNTSWLNNVFSTWEKAIYVTDDPHAAYTVPANKGRESMVYLTYIIDHYESLPSIMIFQHGERYQWHNDDPLYDGERMLRRLQLTHVQQSGYVNLRCVWVLGCPLEIRPSYEEGADLLAADGGSPDTRAGKFYKDAFEHLFPDVLVPDEIGVSCCAQFAVTAETIRKRPKEDYEHYRRWLLETDLDDHLSGRIIEYSWHIIFGRDPIHCPDAKTCYCDVYGLCDLTCEDAGGCSSQYTLPSVSSFPSDWPERGWEGEIRNVTELRELQELDYRPKQLRGS